MTSYTRRDMLAGAAGIGLSTSLGVNQARSNTGGLFKLGVASGDPWPDGIVLWTRLVRDALAADGGMGEPPVEVIWELDEDSARWSLRGGLRGRAVCGSLPGMPWLQLRLWVGPNPDADAQDIGKPWAWMLVLRGTVVRGDRCARKREAKEQATQVLEAELAVVVKVMERQLQEAA